MKATIFNATTNTLTVTADGRTWAVQPGTELPLLKFNEAQFAGHEVSSATSSLKLAYSYAVVTGPGGTEVVASATWSETGAFFWGMAIGISCGVATIMPRLLRRIAKAGGE